MKKYLPLVLSLLLMAGCATSANKQLSLVDIKESIKVNQLTGLCKAISEGRLTSFDDTQFNINAPCTRYGLSPLHVAAWYGNVQAINILVNKYGALVNNKSKIVNTKTRRSGLTPLHIAASRQHIQAVKALIKLKANVNSRDSMGVTPIVSAISQFRIDDNGITTYSGCLAEDKTTKPGMGDSIGAGWGTDCRRDQTNGRIAHQLLDSGADPRIATAQGKNMMSYPYSNYVNIYAEKRIEKIIFPHGRKSSFQVGKLAAMVTGAAIGGLDKLDAGTQAKMIGSMVQDSRAGVEGIHNTKQASDAELERMREKTTQLMNKSNVAITQVKNVKNCRAFAGSYLEGGRFKTHYTVNANCSGTYCVQVLNNPKIPTSGYGWYCQEGRGTKVITSWKKLNGRHVISFKNGQSISRPVAYLKKQ